ncbi:MAG: DUF5721 family protein [Lachnospiraceae bacterium]
MIILNLKAKNCMSHLLLKPTFDDFSFIEGEVTTYNTFKVDGFIHKNFFEEAPEKKYSSWKEVREFFFQIIRGKRTPLGFKFILSLPENTFEDFLGNADVTGITPDNIQGLYLNLKYDGTNLQCITGTSLNIFTMDKTIENVWDEYVKKYFLKHEIDFEL